MATVQIFGEGTHSQKKGCPKNAFIGGCEAGFVKGINSGSHSDRKSKNIKVMRLGQLSCLRLKPELAEDKHALWKEVVKGKLKSITHRWMW
ncbi:hypothetical protein [Paenibacillus sp. FSL H7-0331]|uniref:DUF6979 family protein n=1 Tax=Paenibacillus sp. FSL H7-0331 TaxID=1920421 RepID=UPI00117D3FAA|nr:hypothetical protein [Paenibacillus sp. FSL H7-0331]